MILLTPTRGVDVTSSEPKMPWRRYTANPATTTTTIATSGIQRRLSPPRIENRGIRDPLDKRRHADGRSCSRWTALYQPGCQYDTGPDTTTEHLGDCAR